MLSPEHAVDYRNLSRRRFVGSVLTTASAALLAACAPSPPAAAPTAPVPPAAPTASAEQKPAATVGAKPAQTAPVQAKERKKFKLGLTLPQFIHSYAFVAKDQGFYEKAGLDVEIVEFDADSTALKALIAGELDALEANPSGALASIEKGSDLKIAATYWKKVHFMLYAKNEIKDVPDLAGKAIAISAPNSLPHVLALAVLRDAKIDPDTVNFAAVGANGLVPALVSGKVDASSAAVDLMPIVRKERNLHTVFAYKDRLPRYVRGTLIVSGDRLKGRTGDLATFAVESTRGLRFELDPKNKSDVIKSMANHTKNTNEQSEFALQWFVENKVYEANSYVSPDEIQYMQELNILIGTQEKVLPAERVATWDLQKQVVAALGEFKG